MIKSTTKPLININQSNNTITDTKTNELKPLQTPKPWIDNKDKEKKKIFKQK